MAIRWPVPPTQPHTKNRTQNRAQNRTKANTRPTRKANTRRRTPPQTVTEAETHPLTLRRSPFLLTALALPLGLALFGFAAVQFKVPDWPAALREGTRRGSIVGSDGTILVEGTAEHRRYPQGTLAAHLLGFSGAQQPDGRFGLEGLEYALDSRLQVGETVALTINPSLQAVAQDELRRAVLQHRAENGALVMLEAKTGRVLAAASYPEYDPASHRTVRNREDISNRAFLQQVEPGSTLKPFVVAALMEAGRLHPKETLEVAMRTRVGNQTFSDVLEHGPILSISEIIRLSSNVGMIHLGERFDSAELHDWLADFGFGQNVPLAGAFTRRGQLNPWERWVPQDHASTSIGQSVSTTALQLAAAYGIFANDGLYLPPKVIDDDQPPESRRVLSPEVARSVRTMMVDAVENGEAWRAKIPGTLVAGKTGTADIFSQGRKLPGAYTSSFAGIFPADDPYAVVVVYMQKPQRAFYGSVVAAPIFQKVGSETIALLGLPSQARRLAEY